MSAEIINQKSPIFGLQYIEEEEANQLDVVGCLGLTSETESSGTQAAVTIRLCGDGFDTSAEISE